MQCIRSDKNCKNNSGKCTIFLIFLSTFIIFVIFKQKKFIFKTFKYCHCNLLLFFKFDQSSKFVTRSNTSILFLFIYYF